MLDPTLCTHSASQWLVLKSMFSQWLMTPMLVVPPLVILIALPWMIPKLRWKNQLSYLGIVLILVYFTSSFPLTITLATKGLMTFVPKDSGINADAIVVLGRGQKFNDSRVKVAAELWRNHRAPLIFASGVGDAPLIIEKLRLEGIPQQALLAESCSRTTAENALFTAQVLQSQQTKQIILVSDPPHMLRSLLTFRSLGFTVIPHASPLPSHLAPTKKAMMIFYEYMGLISYGLQGRFLPHTSQQPENHPIAVKII